MTNTLSAQLTEAFGAGRVLTSPQDRATYEHDWRGRRYTESLAVLRPQSRDQVQDMVRFCQAHGLIIVPQGGNTGLCGGSMPAPGLTRPQVILSLGHLNHIRSIDIDNNTLTTDAGVTLQTIQEAATDHERLFPLALASQGSCQIGGNIATNAGGIQVLRYGNMRQLVLGLEVVLPNGELWDGLRTLRKDNTGYDLKQLFIGSEGTLGIITGASLKLFAKPRFDSTAWLSVPSPQAALTVFHRLAHEGFVMSAFELIAQLPLSLAIRHIPGSRAPLSPIPEWSVLVQFDVESDRTEAALSALLHEGLIHDAAVAQNDTQAKSFWALREHLSEAQKIEGPSLKHDISLPLSQIPEFLESMPPLLERALPGTRVVSFGHLGDGNLHFNLFPPGVFASQDALEAGPGQRLTPLVLDEVARRGGSFSAEHGIGQFKVDTLRHYRDPIELELMRRLKAAWDPQHLMNPGKILAHA